jgi:hypothetical protein
MTIAADLHATAEAGVVGVDFDIERSDPEASRDQLQRIKERIIRDRRPRCVGHAVRSSSIGLRSGWPTGSTVRACMSLMTSAAAR